ncbi:MAG: protein-glutamate O-methyltransferase CheR [Ginsengibacter sp.]
MNSDEDVTDEYIEDVLSDTMDIYGYDFSGYSRASIRRRIVRLYSMDNFTNFAAFRYQLRSDVKYFSRFLEQVTVNVTEMFRDPDFFQLLRSRVLPVLGTYPFIRIWIAGCSTGEEAYSMAIILKELNLLHKSLIYATDLNEVVLSKAAKAYFPLQKMQTYTENYLKAGGQKDFSDYYTANYNLAKFDSDLKQKIIFSTHNLVSENSFNQFQLILCRNVLIYFDRRLQIKVLELFNNSLENLGYIGLGSKESLEYSSIYNKYERLTGAKIWRKIRE